ncbi:hypothetical protein VUR80DRAFT_8666 [Thermomyces stellatus]
MASLRAPLGIFALHAPSHVVPRAARGVLACGATARSASSATRWKTRQGSDPFAREAKLKGLKSRAAFKLLEMDAKYRLFKKGQIVVDLGFAPGSWSQVALDRTRPNSHVLGIDILPAQPPRGVSSVQGNFLSPAVQSIVRESLREADARRAALPKEPAQKEEEVQEAGSDREGGEAAGRGNEVVEKMSYLDMEKKEMRDLDGREDNDRVADVVLSDMMMNTSGMAFRDHAGSMDLCYAALRFASDTLKAGGHFVCKFYQGAEDKKLEASLKKMFDKVYREKPDSSRKESREAYFVALRRKKAATYEES